MYIIVRNKQRYPHDYSESNPEYRRAYGEAQEQASEGRLKDAAAKRRWAVKKMRFQGRTPELVAEARGFRHYIERQING